MTSNEPPQYPDYGSAPSQGPNPGGTPPPPSYSPMGTPGGYGPQPKTSPKATWAMIIDILSLLCCGPAGIASVIMGTRPSVRSPPPTAR